MFYRSDHPLTLPLVCSAHILLDPAVVNWRVASSCLNTAYNMVLWLWLGWFMHRFAQCTVIWKLLQNSAIHISHNHNDEIEVAHQCIFPELSQLYDAIILQAIYYTTEQNLYLKYNQFHWKLSTHNLQNRARDSQNHAALFYNARFATTHLGNSLADCGFVMYQRELTHWGRMLHIYVSKLTIIGSDDGLSPGRHQAIIWTNAGILLIAHKNKLQWNFNRN